jgi:hypothetical protein
MLSIYCWFVFSCTLFFSLFWCSGFELSRSSYTHSHYGFLSRSCP